MKKRALHIDIIHILGTNSFILATRRVIAYRGNIKTLYSDSDSNFVDSENEPKNQGYEEMSHAKIQSYLQDSGGDWMR